MSEIPTNMAITANGLSKCGKTTFIDAVVAQANVYQEPIDDQYAYVQELQSHDSALASRSLRFWRSGRFAKVTQISAGNAFRAAAHYVIEEARSGRNIKRFEPDHLDKITEILQEDGIIEHLQANAEIAGRVSAVAAMDGAQKICEPLFSRMVRQAYSVPAEDGHNLVVVDARDPVGLLHRNNAIGSGESQLRPYTILPVFIDTSTEVAASRMPGDYEKSLQEVTERRLLDATRQINPVSIPSPDRLLSSFFEWHSQFTLPPFAADPKELHIKNDELSLDEVKRIAGFVAVAASDAAIMVGSVA